VPDPVEDAAKGAEHFPVPCNVGAHAIGNPVGHARPARIQCHGREQRGMEHWWAVFHREICSW
jgi:hypothetical protein